MKDKYSFLASSEPRYWVEANCHSRKKNEYKGTLDFWLDSASTLCVMCVYVIKIKAKFHWTWESWARNLNLFRYDDPRSSCVLGIFHTFSFPRLPPRPLALSLVCESSNVVFFCSLLSDSQTALRLSQWRINGLLEWTDRLLECGTHIGYRTSAKKGKIWIHFQTLKASLFSGLENH